LYNAAYRGEIQTSSMRDFADRLSVRNSLISDPTLWFWTPAFQTVISWLEENCGRGRTVLDVGCGPGLFLHALRRAGFRGVGLDVAEEAVSLNAKDGFQVWHGPVESLRPGWVQPDAIVCLFVLHHFMNPAGTLGFLRTAFPKAPIVIAQYGPSNFDSSRTTPPRTLTRWNKKALETVLTNLEYRTEVFEIQSTGTESRIMRPLMNLRKSLGLSSGAYRLTKKIERSLLPMILFPFQQRAFVLLAFAKPDVIKDTTRTDYLHTLSTRREK